MPSLVNILKSSFSIDVTGSTHTPTATAFALSVFSQLLENSHKRLVHLLFNALKIKTEYKESDDVKSLAENGNSMVDILLSRQNRSVGEDESRSEVVDGGHSSTREEHNKTDVPSLKLAKNQTIQSEKKSHGKQKTRKMVDRRRKKRKGARNEMSSEEESEEEISNDEGKLSRSSSDHSLSVLSDSGEEDNLEMMESLSESSSSSEDETADGSKSDAKHHHQKVPSVKTNSTGPSPQQHRKSGGKRQIVLAASFNLAPNKTATSSPNLKTSSQIHEIPSPYQTKEDISNSSSSLQTDITPRRSHDGVHLEQLVEETILQTAVHTACCLAGEENYLMIIKVFAHWLQSYPIVIASCTQVGWLVFRTI